MREKYSYLILPSLSFESAIALRMMERPLTTRPKSEQCPKSVGTGAEVMRKRLRFLFIIIDLK